MADDEAPLAEAGPGGLTEVQWREVLAVLAAVLPGATVRMFGSRATGRARPFSDLDLLVVEPPQLGWEQRADLRDRFDASSLPFRIDVVDSAELSGVTAARAFAESVPLPSWSRAIVA